jgi:DNA-binding SARP family transcriptional activator
MRKINTKAWEVINPFNFYNISFPIEKNTLHKEKIMDQFWEDWDDRDFKVALHRIQEVLEPTRINKNEPNFIIRQGVSYQIDLEKVWIDAEALKEHIIIRNEAYITDKEVIKN